MMKNLLTAMLLLMLTTTAFAELTEDNLQAIREIVKQEITASEARTDLKLEKIKTEINGIKTEIAVIKTEINAINKRLDFMQNLIIAVIASIGIMVVLATAMTYLGSKLGNMIPKINDLLKLLEDDKKDSKNDITEKQGDFYSILAPDKLT